jgi:hypothetical protein
MNKFTYKLGYRVSACIHTGITGVKHFVLGAKDEVTDLVVSTGRSVKYKVGVISEATTSLAIGAKDGWKRGNAELEFARAVDDIVKKL